MSSALGSMNKPSFSIWGQWMTSTEPIELTGGKTSGDGHVNVLTIVEWAAFFVLYLRKWMSFQLAR